MQTMRKQEKDSVPATHPISANWREQAQQSSTGLVDEVIAHLRDHVAREQLKPGSKLPSETRIASDLGISRPVVREAMRSLASSGLIELAAGKRAMVVALDGGMVSQVIENAMLIGQADVRDVLELRRGLEIGMVALAAERRTDTTVAELRAISAEMADSIGSARRYSTLDMQLHLALATASGNPLYTILIEAFRQVFEASMLTGIARWSATPELAKVQELHDAIVQAVDDGDPAAAADAMARHFDEAIAAIVAG